VLARAAASAAAFAALAVAAAQPEDGGLRRLDRRAMSKLSRSRHPAGIATATGVGASRVYLGVHWPSDVLAGWLFAEGWLYLASVIIPAPAARPAGSAATGEEKLP
jgi:membrane-associated phospholipid phosphatase